jgi:hypothetical protein
MINTAEYTNDDSPNGQLHIVSSIRPSIITNTTGKLLVRNGIAAIGIKVIDGKYGTVT